MKIVIACALILVATSATAQSQFDGQEWSGWSTGERTMYLVGWVDGRAEGTWNAIAALDHPLFAKGEAALADPRLKSLRASVTVGQLLVGTTGFYKDYKNLNISVRTAVAIVNDQLTGTNITEEYLQRIREIEAESATKHAQ